MNAANPHAQAAGMGLAMLVIIIFAVIFFPVTVLVVAAVRSGEYVPRFIHWVGRKLRLPWAQ